MNHLAIKVQGLGKAYKIGSVQEPYLMLRDVIIQSLTAPFRRAYNLLQGEAYGAAELSESIWALKDINLEVEHGEVVGIIGRNGAGKSTLLKVLSRITEPTEGMVELYGRVGALLEVGTGFHVELTGRENIYLNGAILGMSRRDIDRRFDEIVEFSGVEKFIDTPVKHYSSGMRLRLGFSVAAHLEPEILIVDEVLAVGDAEFQKKCLGKMGDVAGEGRTVLFVSHNMAAIRTLCHRAILLEAGRMRYQSTSADVVDYYLSTAFPSLDSERPDKGIWDKDGSLCLRKHQVALIQTDQGTLDLDIQLELEPTEALHKVGIGIMLSNIDGIKITRIPPKLSGHYILNLTEKTKCRLTCTSINRYLSSGTYFLDLWVSLTNITHLIYLERAATIQIPEYDLFGTGKAFSYSDFGIVPLPLKFEFDQPSKSTNLPGNLDTSNEQ